MNAAAALMAAAAVLLIAAPPVSSRLSRRVGRYLESAEPAGSGSRRTDPALLRAGLSWTPADLRVRRLLAAAAGAFAGLLLAQGDLFLTGPGRSAGALAAAGAAGGLLGLNVWMTNRRERRAAMLRHELPVVADALALGMMAGESVASALEHFTETATGVACRELEAALAAYREGDGLSGALLGAARITCHPDAGRLYELLANAHHTGGRVAGDLAGLAADYRAALSRDLTAEGGKRALAVYGPILALMIPTTLLFIVYPTLAGLRTIGAGP